MNIVKSSCIALVVCLFSNLGCAAVWTASYRAVVQRGNPPR
jgi:hypothetical protein